MLFTPLALMVFGLMPPPPPVPLILYTNEYGADPITLLRQFKVVLAAGTEVAPAPSRVADRLHRAVGGNAVVVEAAYPPVQVLPPILVQSAQTEFAPTRGVFGTWVRNYEGSRMTLNLTPESTTLKICSPSGSGSTVCQFLAADTVLHRDGVTLMGVFRAADVSSESSSASIANEVQERMRQFVGEPMALTVRVYEGQLFLTDIKLGAGVAKSDADSLIRGLQGRFVVESRHAIVPPPLANGFSSDSVAPRQGSQPQRPFTFSFGIVDSTNPPHSDGQIPVPAPWTAPPEPIRFEPAPHPRTVTPDRLGQSEFGQFMRFGRGTFTDTALFPSK